MTDVVTNLYWKSDDIDKSLPEAIEWLQGMLSQVPPEFHSRTSFEVGLEHDYDGPSSLDVRVCWSRPETPEETEKRQRDERERKEASARSELERARWNYERLKAQFEPSEPPK